MKKMNRKDRETIAKAIKERLADDFADQNFSDPEHGRKKYRVRLQGSVYETILNDGEIDEMISICFEILDELVQKYNGGMKYEALKKEYEKHGIGADYNDNISEFFKLIYDFATPKISDCIGRLDDLCRVGGAYAILIANPVFYSAIISAFDRLIYAYDVEKSDASTQTLYFLVRAAMKMGSEKKL